MRSLSKYDEIIKIAAKNKTSMYYIGFHKTNMTIIVLL